MKNSLIHTIELIIGALLIGLALIYLMTQYKALTQLTDIITLRIVENKEIIQQYNIININQVSDEELYSAIMSYREYKIMVDKNIVPIYGHDYDLYFTYIKDGFYRKEYQYGANKDIVMIIYTYMGL